MARSRETKIELTAYDDLFQTDESRAEAKLSKIRDIPLSQIDEFPDHPFKVLMDCDLFRLGNYLPIKRQSNTCYRTFTKSYTFSIYYRNLGYGGAETNYTDDSKYTNVFTFRFYIPCCIQESSYLL